MAMRDMFGRGEVTSIDDAFDRARSFADACELRAQESPGTSPVLAPAPRPPSGPTYGGSGLFGRGRSDHNTGWVHAAVRAIANRVAGQPIRLGRKVRRRGVPAAVKSAPAWVGSVEPVESHRLLEVLNDPNELMTAWALMFMTVAGLELHGRAYWLIANEDGRTRLYPLPSGWVTPQHAEGRFYASYEVRTPGVAEPMIVSGDEMVRFAYPDADDPLGSVSPFHAQARAIDADNSIQTAQARAFRDGIHPGVIVTTGGRQETPGVQRRARLNEQQIREISEAIKRRYRGVLQSGEPLILDDMITDVKPFTRTSKEMDWMSSSRLTKERILEGFGVSEIVLGHAQNANRAGSVVADELLCSNAVNPKLMLISQCMTAWLCPRFGSDLVLWIEPAVPHDPEQTRADREQLIRAKAVTINEARGWQGLPAIQGGDVLVGGGT
jgi:HK97 family phage portal protein